MKKIIYSTGKQRCIESKPIGSIGSIGEGEGSGTKWKISTFCQAELRLALLPLSVPPTQPDKYV